MSMLEATALAIILAIAVALVILAIVWDAQDRRPLDPPEPAPEPPPYRGAHRNWGPTTRLRPPDRPQN
jgi:hypothetical protein